MRIDDRDCGMGMTSVKKAVRPVGAYWDMMCDMFQGHRGRCPWLRQSGPLAHTIHVSLCAVNDEPHSVVTVTTDWLHGLSNWAM